MCSSEFLEPTAEQFGGGTSSTLRPTTPVFQPQLDSQDTDHSIQTSPTTAYAELPGFPNMGQTTAPPSATRKNQADIPGIPTFQEEDRENLQHFADWAKPETRDRPGKFLPKSLVSTHYPNSCAVARVRKIILYDLPSIANATFVQSLICGGQIDTFNIHGKTAQVSFCDPEACENFFTTFFKPNGLLIKREGRQYLIKVGKAKEVEPVSSVLRTQLECGATRCVKAVGADEDLRIAELHRLAAGRNRKVEKILDEYSGQGVSLHVAVYFVPRSELTWSLTHFASDTHRHLSLHEHRRRCQLQSPAYP